MTELSLREMEDSSEITELKLKLAQQTQFRYRQSLNR